MSHLISLQGLDLHYLSVAFKERSLKSLLSGWVRPSFGPKPVHDIHALKKLNVEIGPGERVGLLGPNGSGKTSFLRVVAGLYPISGGTKKVEGNIRALFDLGLGFEPEATGRENILYRGLLMGLTRRQAAELEKSIVDFAGLGEFIDYPLKTYSAGMQVRLAFSVSTVVSGDILLLDEVIGAGDAAFMVKAKERVLEMVEHSSILILASHDLSALREICQRGLVFDQGRITFDGPIGEAVAVYQSMNGIRP